MAKNDKNVKKKRRFNAVDIIAVVFVIAVVAGVVWRFAAPGADISAGSKTVTYELRVEGVRPFTVPFYEVGMKCYDDKTDGFIGVIKDVKVEHYYATRVGRDGVPFKVKHPYAVNVFLTIEADGRETDGAFYANTGYKLKVGSEVKLVTRTVDVNALITSVEGRGSVTRTEPYSGTYDRP